MVKFFEKAIQGKVSEKKHRLRVGGGNKKKQGKYGEGQKGSKAVRLAGERQTNEKKGKPNTYLGTQKNEIKIKEKL